MAEEITRETLCRDTAAIMRRVEAGETFVIMDGGVLVAELGPISGPRFVTRDQVQAAFSGGPPVDFERFRRDLERPGDRVHPTDVDDR